MSGISRGLAVFAAILCFGAIAPSLRAAEGKDDSASASREQAPPPIGVLTERSGGSLARAMLSGEPDRPGGAMPAYSFLAVPEPKPKLLKKHDLVTIIVNEQSAFSVIGDNNLQKTADYDAQLNNYLKLRLNSLALVSEAPANALEMKASGQRDLKGTATVDRTDSLTARITATVVDVKPNGTIVLEASEEIKTDEEEQKMVLTGTCRVDDVSNDNTLSSNQLFDLHLTKMHKGQVRDTTKRGLIPRFLDWFDLF